jgi:tetratricopeptide (TPR) repeat protein
VAVSVLAAAAVSFCSIVLPGRAAASQSNISYVSTSTWTAEPAARRVHVQTEVKATSHSEDSGDRRYFYDRLEMTLPPFSANFAAALPGGKKLATSVDQETAAGTTITVSLGQRLYAGMTGSFSLAFDLVDAMGTTDRDFRISENVVSFPVWAFGSANTSGSSVKVVFPAGFTVQEEFGDLTVSSSDAKTLVFSSGIVPDATAVDAWFTAVKPVPESDFRVRLVTIGNLNVTLRYWVDDPGWADQVQSVLEAGYPILRTMIGLGDPSETTITVQEASTEEIGGFSGSYDSGSGTAQISYFADPFIILHETSHLWFNVGLISDRWVQEGFASYYAEQAVQRLGYVDHAPVLTDRIAQNAIPLNDWVGAAQPNSSVEAFLYGASLKVATQIAAQAGQVALRAVWVAARDGLAAYQAKGAAKPEIGGGTTDWRRLLDLVEQKTGSQYSAIWRAWIVDPSQSALLDQRDAALASYQAALSEAGSWDLPSPVRISMDNWQFSQALATLTQVRAILAQRDEIAALSATEGTTPPAVLKTDFEAAGLPKAQSEADNELAALGVLTTARLARAGSGGAARAVALFGSDPDADLAAARKAFARGDLNATVTLAEEARGVWQDSNAAAQVRLIGVACALIGSIVLLLVVLWSRGLLALAAWPRFRMTRRWWRRNRRAAAAAAAAASEADAPDSRAAPVSDDGVGDAAGESSYGLFQRGQLLLLDRHHAQAAVVLERAAKLERGKGSILEALGRAYFNSGQHARAVETFQALLEVDPSADYGHFGLGLSLARLGRVQEARTHLRLAAALDPASDVYQRALGKIEMTPRPDAPEPDASGSSK